MAMRVRRKMLSLEMTYLDVVKAVFAGCAIYHFVYALVYAILNTLFRRGVKQND